MQRKIESLRLTFLQCMVEFGYYDEGDLVTTNSTLGMPALLFERHSDSPSLFDRTSLVVTLKDYKTANIDLLYISPDERNKNFGTCLYSTLEHALICEGIQRATLEAHGILQMRFWTKQGFYPIGQYRYEKLL